MHISADFRPSVALPNDLPAAAPTQRQTLPKGDRGDLYVPAGAADLEFRSDTTIGDVPSVPFSISRGITLAAGSSFLPAVAAARDLAASFDGEEGAVALLQASDGVFYLAQPTTQHGDALHPMFLDLHDGTAVRSNLPQIQAVVSEAEWVDLR